MTLRARVTATAIAITLFVALAFAFIGALVDRQAESRFTAEASQAKGVLWQKIVASQLDQMEPQTAALTRDRATLSALVAGDKTALAENIESTYNRLTQLEVLTMVRVADSNGRIVYTAPARASSSADNQLVQRAIADRIVTRGIERDGTGQLVASLAFPLYNRGNIVGAGIFSRELTRATNDFKVNDQSDVLILGPNEQLHYATDETLQPLLTNEAMPLGAAGHGWIAKQGDKVYLVSTQPILSAENEPLATFVSLKDYSEGYAAQQFFQRSAYAIVAGLLVLGLVGLYFYMRHSLAPLNSVAACLDRMAAGDLRDTITPRSNDEIGRLETAMRSMLEQMREMIRQVNEATTDLGQSSTRMSAVTESTRQGVQQQTEDVDQAVTAMTEMSAAVREVARSAQDAATAADHADVEAQQGQKVVRTTIEMIDALANEVEHAAGVIHQLEIASDSIGSVLDVIRGIADQTNLLALNAAIEAARAGEQGRGFAVVADEVRTLASRTQESTTEIQGMIQKLQQEAKNAVQTMEASCTNAKVAVQQASETGSSLERITTAVGRINQMNTHIASAAEEQGTVAEDINQTVVRISQVAERNAEGAANTAQASEEMHGLAGRLRELVGRFRV